MPVELQIIRASEFIRVGARGRLDLAGSSEILKKLAAACRRRGIDRALLDVRDLRTNLTPTDLATLVRSFRDIGFSHSQRLAVLHTGDQSYRARLFSLIGVLRGWKVSAFVEFEEALAWLSSEAKAEAPKKEQPIPVRNRSTRMVTAGAVISMNIPKARQPTAHDKRRII
jgi:hypothetical protein